MLAQIRQRFNIENPELCHRLRWKGQFIAADRDPTVPMCNDGLFWCSHTQKCIGPDGQLAEPGSCSSPDRSCHEGHPGS